MQHMKARQLADYLQQQSPLLLDVREPSEYEHCHIPGSTLIPMGEIIARLSELQPDQEIVVICHHGRRSHQVGLYLEQENFSRIINLDDGIDGWAKTVDPSMPTY
jgi:rhodanese-related sulfurtransferase